MSALRIRSFAVAAVAALALAACEQPPTLGKTHFVVVPDADGKVGEITVDDGVERQLIEAMHATSADYFALPYWEKMRLKCRRTVIAATRPLAPKRSPTALIARPSPM